MVFRILISAVLLLFAIDRTFGFAKTGCLRMDVGRTYDSGLRGAAYGGFAEVCGTPGAIAMGVLVLATVGAIYSLLTLKRKSQPKADL